MLEIFRDYHQFASDKKAAPSLTARAILTTVYAAGLRVSAVVELQVPDLDGAGTQIRVRQGKGRKDIGNRLAPLRETLGVRIQISPSLLRILFGGVFAKGWMV